MNKQKRIETSKEGRTMSPKSTIRKMIDRLIVMIIMTKDEVDNILERYRSSAQNENRMHKTSTATVVEPSVGTDIASPKRYTYSEDALALVNDPTTLVKGPADGQQICIPMVVGAVMRNMGCRLYLYRRLIQKTQVYFQLQTSVCEVAINRAALLMTIAATCDEENIVSELRRASKMFMLEDPYGRRHTDRPALLMGSLVEPDTRSIHASYRFSWTDDGHIHGMTLCTDNPDKAYFRAMHLATIGTYAPPDRMSADIQTAARQFDTEGFMRTREIGEEWDGDDGKHACKLELGIVSRRPPCHLYYYRTSVDGKGRDYPLRTDDFELARTRAEKLQALQQNPSTDNTHNELHYVSTKYDVVYIDVTIASKTQGPSKVIGREYVTDAGIWTRTLKEGRLTKASGDTTMYCFTGHTIGPTTSCSLWTDQLELAEQRLVIAIDTYTSSTPDTVRTRMSDLSNQFRWEESIRILDSNPEPTRLGPRYLIPLACGSIFRYAEDTDMASCWTYGYCINNNTKTKTMKTYDLAEALQRVRRFIQVVMFSPPTNVVKELNAIAREWPDIKKRFVTVEERHKQNDMKEYTTEGGTLTIHIGRGRLTRSRNASVFRLRLSVNKESQSYSTRTGDKSTAIRRARKLLECDAATPDKDKHNALRAMSKSFIKGRRAYVPKPKTNEDPSPATPPVSESSTDVSCDKPTRIEIELPLGSIFKKTPNTAWYFRFRHSNHPYAISTRTFDETIAKQRASGCIAIIQSTRAASKVVERVKGHLQQYPRPSRTTKSSKKVDKTTCGFVSVIGGVCQNKLPCREHEHLRCVSCGSSATHECHEMNGLPCGEALCDDCEHLIFPDGTNGGIGSNAQSLPDGLPRHIPRIHQRYDKK